MVRYINKDEFIAQIQDNFCTECNNYDGVKCRSCGIDDTIEMVENADEADVVPKSEVERLTVELDAMRGAANTYKMHYENAMKEIERLKDYNTGVAFKHYFDGRKEVAREIFEELARKSTYVFPTMLYTIAKRDVDELKKKYIGGNDNG